MSEQVQQFSEDDWVDQDILTKELAGSLLDDEIAAERRRIEQFSRGEEPDDAIASRAETERRLAAMLAIRGGLTDGDDV